ncbi:MAG: VWA domain-containing protein, partial [bacterium]|nr:VWA domain-containing protein [bacterium]
EREVVRFSSLMFVPNRRREVIELQRVQHPLLMLLRMVLLLILALAFTRPYWKIFLEGETPEFVSRLHVILLDTSLSMKTKGVLEAAKGRAQEILNDLPEGDRVGVVTFGRSTRVLAPLFDPERIVGSVSDAQGAVRAAQATWEDTDYETGLQTAERLLKEAGGEDVQRIVHLISDFQEAGMPHETSGWRLATDIELKAVVVASKGQSNYAVQALAVQPVGDGQLQIRARVKNWMGGKDRAVRVDLVVGAQVVASRALTVLPGHASQVRFTLPWDGETAVGGFVTLEADDLEADNRRYFAFNSPRKYTGILIRSSVRGERWPYDRLVQAAVPKDADLPWQLTSVSSSQPDIDLSDEMVLSGAPLGNGAADRLRKYAEGGGKLLLILHRGAKTDGVNRLLEGTGVQLGEPYVQKADPGVFESLSWVDFEHRIFHPFRGPRFNDFSAVRFYNYFKMGTSGDARVIARFDNGDPAMVEASLGNGQVLVWAGGIEASWTNLARRPRFLPLLYETLGYLAGNRPDVTEFAVGESAARPVRNHRAVERWEATFEGVDAIRLMTSDRAEFFDQPGLFRWTVQAKERMAGINVAAEESDPAPIQVSEFEIRLCDAPVVVAQGGITDMKAGVFRQEYGLWMIGCVLGLLVIESGYAAWLAQKSEKDV